MQAELKALKSRMNNTEEWISDWDNKKKENTKSGKQGRKQNKKKKKDESNMRCMGE